jgi:2-polyprenyl-3-methyl-5-hydroxy-6-metoxy-1,4-benzoquinol methylase
MSEQAQQTSVEFLSQPCPSCGQPTSHRLCYLKWGYPIYSCSECGLGSTSLESDVELSTIYDQSYFQGGRADGYADYAASAPVLRREFRRLIELTLRPRVSEGALLEVGCAYGYLLEEASSFYRCQGVELSSAALEVCREKGLEVVSDMEDLDSGNLFDITVMLDVIEHLPAPGQTLEQIRARMRPGGLLVLTTGDWGSLLARVMGRNWRLMTPPQHLWFFTAHSLRLLLHRSGFQVESIEHPWKIVPLDLVLYQVTRRLGLPGVTAAWMTRVGLPLNLFDALRVTAVAR